MNIAVLSDIHDNVWSLEKSLKIIEKKKIKTAIFCGDYCAPTSFKQATERFSKAYCIWGNVDGEKFAITKYLYEAKIKHVELLGDFGEIEIDNRKIAIIHRDDIAQGLAHSGLYNAVFYGHDHIASIKHIGKTLLVNPGEIMGKGGKPSFGIYNTKDNTFKIVTINWVKV